MWGNPSSPSFITKRSICIAFLRGRLEVLEHDYRDIGYTVCVCHSLIEETTTFGSPHQRYILEIFVTLPHCLKAPPHMTSKTKQIDIMS